MLLGSLLIVATPYSVHINMHINMLTDLSICAGHVLPYVHMLPCTVCESQVPPIAIFKMIDVYTYKYPHTYTHTHTESYPHTLTHTHTRAHILTPTV